MDPETQVRRLFGGLFMTIGVLLLLSMGCYWFLSYRAITNRLDREVVQDWWGRTLPWEEGMKEAYFARYEDPPGDDIPLWEAVEHTPWQIVCDGVVFLVLLTSGGALVRVGWRMVQVPKQMD